MIDNIKVIYNIKSIEPISLKKTQKIIEQMNSNSIFRINAKETGFFVKIQYKLKLLHVLITTTVSLEIRTHLPPREKNKFERLLFFE